MSYTHHLLEKVCDSKKHGVGTHVVQHVHRLYSRRLIPSPWCVYKIRLRQSNRKYSDVIHGFSVYLFSLFGLMALFTVTSDIAITLARDGIRGTLPTHDRRERTTCHADYGLQPTVLRDISKITIVRVASIGRYRRM